MLFTVCTCKVKSAPCRFQTTNLSPSRQANDDNPCISTKVRPNTLCLSTFSLSELPVIYKVSVLPLGPPWPCMETYMCWADLQCFQMMFHTVRVDLSEWGKKFPGNRHIPQTSLECFYRMARGPSKTGFLQTLQNCCCGN